MTAKFYWVDWKSSSCNQWLIASDFVRYLKKCSTDMNKYSTLLMTKLEVNIPVFVFKI